MPVVDSFVCVCVCNMVFAKGAVEDLQNGPIACDSSRVASFYAKDASSVVPSGPPGEPIVIIKGRDNIAEFYHVQCVAFHELIEATTPYPHDYNFVIDEGNLEFWQDQIYAGSYGEADFDVFAPPGTPDAVTTNALVTSLAKRTKGKKAAHAFEVVHESQVPP